MWGKNYGGEKSVFVEPRSEQRQSTSRQKNGRENGLAGVVKQWRGQWEED